MNTSLGCLFIAMDAACFTPEEGWKPDVMRFEQSLKAGRDGKLSFICERPVQLNIQNHNIFRNKVTPAKRGRHKGSHGHICGYGDDTNTDSI
jgi:hypothetical protein